MNTLSELEGRKCLVTGGAGFIGSHICERLIRDGAKVICFDNLSSGKLEHLDQIRRAKGFRFVKGDLLDSRAVLLATRHVEIVFHLGALVGVRRYVEDPIDVIRTNVLGTHNVLEACLRSKVSRLVFASTSEVYGKNPEQPLSENSDRVLGPASIDRWCYSSSKAIDEHLINGYQRTRGLESVILRYFNTYGPRQDASDYGAVVSIFMRRVRDNESPLVHGDGKQTRSFCYIDDAIEGTSRAAVAEGAVNETFNIGYPAETSIIHLAELVCGTAGKAKAITPKFIKHDAFYGQWYEDIPRRVPDISKAKKLLDFDPSISLEDGLRRTWQYYNTGT